MRPVTSGMSFFTIIFDYVIDVIVCQPEHIGRVEGSEEYLLEILDVDCTIAFIKIEKGFVTFFVYK